MSPSKTKPRLVGDTGREPQPKSGPARRELALALHEAHALLTAAHVIESIVGPLAWSATPKQIQTALASVRKQGPNLIERLMNVCVRLERLTLLTERVPVEPSSKETEERT